MRFSFFLVLFFVFVSTHAHASLRTTNMNHDIILNQTLYQALSSGFGKVNGIRRSTALTGAPPTFTVSSQDDLLSCSPAGCNLTWDSVSKNYPAAAGVFQSALFDTLENWATQTPMGQASPYLRRTIYPQTGSVQIVLSSGPGNEDQIRCTLLNPHTPLPIKDCSMQVSDINSGQTKELKVIYESLLNTKSLVDVVKDAVLASVSTAGFLPEGDLQFGNRTYTVAHTVYTSLLIDKIVASSRYAYKTPIKNSAGKVMSHGIEVTLSGHQFVKGNLVLQEVSARSYVLAHPER